MAEAPGGFDRSSLASRLVAALADRYRLERELGAGGMATVYLAEDLKHHRKVAVKVLHPELAAFIGAERFLAEIRTTANLQHPHILPLHDSGQADAFLYYVMPYVAGESLRARLSRERQLSLEEAVRIAQEVAGALDYAHRQGVVHRDIKPENILLHEGQALVADFGIALAVSSAGQERMTQTGMSLGTPEYMSPEQALGERNVTAKSDIYALGCVLYEMLTGEPPFTGATVQAVLAKVMNDRPTPPSVTRETVPSHIETAVLKALARLPADRFPSALAFAGALVTSGAGDHPLARAPIRSTWRERAAIPALLVAALAVIAAGWFARRGSAPSLPPPIRYALDVPWVEPRRADIKVALSPDGRNLVYVAPSPDSATTMLWLRKTDGLTSTAIPGTEGALSAFFSPEGDQIAFLTDDPLTLRTVAPGSAPVRVAEVRGGVVIGTGGAWGEDGAIYLGGPGYRQLVRLDLRTGATEPVTVLDSLQKERWHGWPHLLPGGRHLLFTVVDSTLQRDGYRIGIADLESRQHRVLLRGVQAHYLDPGFLLVVDAEGGLTAYPFDLGTLEVAERPVHIASGIPIRSAAVDCDVSPAGVLVHAAASGSEEPAGVATDSGQAVWVARDGTRRPVDPGWTFPVTAGSLSLSPDESRLAIVIRGDIWVKDLDQGSLLRLTTDGGGAPAWSDLGAALIYRNPRSRVVVQARMDGAGKPDTLFRSLDPVGAISQAGKGSWLVWELWREGSQDVMGWRPGRDSLPSLLFAGPFNESNPKLSPDERWDPLESTCRHASLSIL